MREILFRGKTKKREWIEGDLLSQKVQMDPSIGRIETEFVHPIDWEQRRYEIAKAAMQGIVSNYGLKYKDNHAAEAVAFADELINQLKNNPMK